MTILIAVILYLAGFLLIAKQTVTDAIDPNRRGVVLVLLAFVYTCFAGGFAVVAYLYGDPGLVLYTLFLLFALAEVWNVASTLVRSRHEIRLKYAVLFLLCLLVILLVTLFSRAPRSQTVLQTELFSAVKAALAHGSVEELNHMILNIVLFVPLGYLFVQMDPPKFGNLFQVLGIGALISTVIESCQLLFRLGNCDVDDILANTIGTVLGLVVYRFVRRLDR